MYLETKQDRSVYYWLKGLFEEYPFVNVVDGFPDEILKLPTVSVEIDVIDSYPFELGNRHLAKTRIWYVDVFASNKGQRNEFAYRVLNELEDTIPVYNYDEGFPPEANPSKLGGLIPSDIRLEIIKVLPELVDTLYYRATVTFTATYDTY